ncbi:MAG: ABC-type transporter, substrate-binding lipoprotein [Parachlamydiales bacterium]|nr:ABC-type transporter, substrate-binding lipoprotein [Parachlamydiales bacterium]
MNILRAGFIFFLTLLTGCEKSPPPSAFSPKPLVLVSVAPYQCIVQRIGGKHIEVSSIAASGADIHSFEPTPRQREAIKDATLWFRIGEPFENLLLSLFQNHRRVVDLREGIEMLPGSSACCLDAENQDRHMWMSPGIVQMQAKAISQALSDQFPDHKNAFETNLSALLRDLASLDQEIRTSLESQKNHILLVSHPAFGYFCRDYSLQQLSVECEGKDPCPKHIECLLRQGKKRPPVVAIALPQHNNKGTQLIANELHVPIKTIDPYSCEYFDTMRSLTQWILFK